MKAAHLALHHILPRTTNHTRSASHINKRL